MTTTQPEVGVKSLIWGLISLGVLGVWSTGVVQMPSTEGTTGLSFLLLVLIEGAPALGGDFFKLLVPPIASLEGRGVA